MRRSISTKLPEIGRFDHVASGVTWNSTSVPFSRRAPVTSGVPSARFAQVRSTMSGVGSASTCRVTVTSLGGGRSANGPVGGNSVTGCGVVQDSAPPSERSPRRRRTGSSSSSLPAAASREPAKRTSVPPFFTQSISCVRAAVGDGADIGHDDHRRLLLEKLRDRLGEIRARRLDEIGEGLAARGGCSRAATAAAAPGRPRTATAARRGGAWNSRRARGRRRPAARRRWRSRRNRCAVRTAPSSGRCRPSRPGRR